ncbi:MAG: addiction module antidote protein, HigA family [Bdellovibrio sp. CG12_big_fil_rev_8_21_14_0_65_39_13]|nr:MAG: addiction module antidote protein, HigA family [Bdellovibrio sp. CG22_combo_CG10-13_8_21_14_all_39_27]PIQ61390.1 MAG: addiction module antidote protein, HigA family [Bdellovibrio sp. CG12_big_fil_rev_8_21_14_0_65_39_13]PIR33204.1 MAG: addiction module antidote protein, HigA family [Bdellovibrio sp. CG11_big_fil_rev_8_21_14_0_20_39_38]
MKTLKREKMNRRPSSPGEVLGGIFLEGNNITQAQFAQDLSDLTSGRIKTSTMKTKLSEVLNDKRAISAEFAILISKLLGTNPKMWMSLQASLDLWIAEKELEKVG